MMLGETVKIGLWMDSYSLLDFICIIICMIEICILLMIFKKREKKKLTSTKAFLCLLMIILVFLIPYILHYNYSALAVWFSPCVLIAMTGIEICFAEYIILYLCSRKNTRQKS